MSSSTVSKLDALAGLHGAKRLVRRLAQGDIGSHAVLLYGAPGSGKSKLGELLAEAWLCRNPGPEGADGDCKACSAFGRGNNTDFLLISPQGPSRIIPVAAIVKENPLDDEPLPLLTFFRTMPLISRHKVTLIQDAHRMNEAASNSLLKTLEEPHPHAKLVLTTDSIGGVRSTILSRCLAVACELPPVDELARLAQDTTPQLMRLAGGAPGRISDIRSNAVAMERLARFGDSLLTLPPGAALNASEQFRLVCEGLLQDKAAAARTSNAYGLELLATYVTREPAAPPQWTSAILAAHRRILGNGNPTLVFDAMFAQMLAG